MLNDNGSVALKAFDWKFDNLQNLQTVEDATAMLLDFVPGPECKKTHAHLCFVDFLSVLLYTAPYSGSSDHRSSLILTLVPHDDWLTLLRSENLCRQHCN